LLLDWSIQKKKLQNKNPSFRLGEQTHSTLARTTIRGWFDSFFASLFYVTQWVGRSNLTLLVENGPVLRLARRTLGYQFLVSAEEDVSLPGGKRVRADVHLVYRLGTDNCEFAYFVTYRLC
jgi:hypothetical protein